ncbi:MAG: hypothetical protein ACE37F_28020 [Nannocystaceae bacterium]|nr:hypothetical protein [bacterium]
MIQDAAVKCRFCGEWLDPSKRPDYAQAGENAPVAAPAPEPDPAGVEVAPMGAPAPVLTRQEPGPGPDIDPAATTTDGSVHRPRRRETQTWSAPAWMNDDDEPKASASQTQPGATADERAPSEDDSPQMPAAPIMPTAPAVEPTAPAVELIGAPAPAEPVEQTIDDVAERMKRIKASAAAVREAMLQEVRASDSQQPEVLGDDDDAEAAVTMHAGSRSMQVEARREEPAPQPPPDVAAMLGDDFDDDFDDDDDDDDFDDDDDDDDLGPPAAAPRSAKPSGDDELGDALPAGGALAGFSFDDDDDDDFGDDDDDFDGDFGDVGASRPIPWKPVAAGAAVVLVLGVGFFWDRMFPSETIEEDAAGEEANKDDGDEAPADGQVAQGSVAPPPGQGQPVVPEGQPAAAVGAPVAPAPAAPAAAVPVDPAAAVPVDPAVQVDPAAADPAAAAADPTAVPNTPAPTPLAGDAVAVLDEARGLYQKGGKKRLGSAKEKLQGILSTTPNNADALLLMAQVQLELGETEASLETATKCTSVSPQTADCWLSIGVLKQNAKDKPAAAAAYERYLALAPEGAYASQVKKQLSRLQ